MNTKNPANKIRLGISRIYRELLSASSVYIPYAHFLPDLHVSAFSDTAQVSTRYTQLLVPNEVMHSTTFKSIQIMLMSTESDIALTRTAHDPFEIHGISISVCWSKLGSCPFLQRVPEFPDEPLFQAIVCACASSQQVENVSIIRKLQRRSAVRHMTLATVDSRDK